MKKVLMTLLIVSMLVLPLGSVALAENTETSHPEVTDFVPGTVPAQTSSWEAMTPAIHAALLAALNHDAAAFSADDEVLAWEGLYNMLSMYGQMDDRAEYQDDLLILPSETIYDYAAALLDSFSPAGVPEALADRIVYDEETDCYQVVCGSDDLSELVLDPAQEADGQVILTGALRYVVDGTPLARFQAVLVPQDNMFGCFLASLELA